MGLFGYGPVLTPVELKEALASAIADVVAGAAAVVDVRVGTAGSGHDVGARIGRGAEG
jgi:hypothetical protein